MKFLSTIIICLLCCLSLSAQQDNSLFTKDSSKNDLFKKDWSSFDHLLRGSPNLQQQQLSELDLRSDITLNDLILEDMQANPNHSGRVVDMPIHKPDGTHAMPIFQVYDPNRFYLRILPSE
ncbi:hypothetical protein [Poritiphilus flavus]|uniref:Uncharacterized protein n=1 Tax=Poritiphilus flavus TaxID=2697053 RepID=A0A6L9EDZ8_9FLAO|nr:hypothetical protein [Poritiphilus flavus]NAS12871.1 hypothetical protein [Poritiphilus flavus]